METQLYLPGRKVLFLQILVLPDFLSFSRPKTRYRKFFSLNSINERRIFNLLAANFVW